MIGSQIMTLGSRELKCEAIKVSLGSWLIYQRSWFVDIELSFDLLKVYFYAVKQNRRDKLGT
jgi:hypothetical protein